MNTRESLSDSPCTMCGATPETGQRHGCPECQGITEPHDTGSLIVPRCAKKGCPNHATPGFLLCAFCAALGGNR